MNNVYFYLEESLESLNQTEFRLRNFFILAPGACHDHIPALLDRNFSHWLGFFSRFITSPPGYVTAIMRSSRTVRAPVKLDVTSPRDKRAKVGR